MRITAVDTTLLTLPSDGGRPRPDGPGAHWNEFTVLLVKVSTDEGLVGWGEAFGHNIAPATQVTIDGLLGPMLVGADVDDRVGLGERVNRGLHMFGRNGCLTYALSGIDIALWDLAGKRAGLPLHRLLGGGGHPQVEAYASLLSYVDPADVAVKAKEAVVAGYRHVKLHESGVAQVEAARAAVGPDVELMLDTNCSWTLEQGLDMARDLAPSRLRWVEDAVWPPEDHAAMAALRRAGLRVAAGENVGTVPDFQNLLRAGAVDVAQPDVTKVGGVTELLKVITLAQAWGVTVSPHSACLGPGFLATVHVVAAMAEPTVVERLYLELGPDAAVMGPAVDPVQGWLTVPTGPGLGADPDPEVVERYAS